MLALEVTLLTGRYVATAYDDRNRAEWPPHPARLFSAMVAAHFEGEDLPHERGALEWLEQQGAPAIHASAASAREVATVFVPVNDLTVVGSLEDEAHSVEQARIDVERAEGKARAAAEKKLAKQQARLAEATKKAIATVPAGKETKEGPGIAAALLPDGRKKQPRTFPSVTPEDPRITFAWDSAEPAAETRAALDTLAARVIRLGHSSSLVSVRVNDAFQPMSRVAWTPDETGELDDVLEATTLRAVLPDQLQALQEVFATQEDVPGRVMPATFQRYVRRASGTSERPARGVFGDDWLVLRRLSGAKGGSWLPSVRTVDVARRARDAMMSAFGPSAPEILSGHAPDGGPTSRPHAAYVPLPYVGSAHADGTIMGIAIVVPRATNREGRDAVAAALDRWQTRHGRRLDDDGPVAVPIHLGRGGSLWISQLEEEPRPGSALAVAGWCRDARVWASATPVALDRNPGDLQARDPCIQAKAYAEAEATVRGACEHVGLPAPTRVTVLPAAPVRGSAKARAFPAFMSGKPPIRRVLVHAALEFEQSVRGPILLGAGRYWGLGLFRPMG